MRDVRPPLWISLHRPLTCRSPLIPCWQCPLCRAKPHHAAVCLLCGAFVCSGSEACRPRGRGGFTRHAEVCGRHSSALVLVKLTQVRASVAAATASCNHRPPQRGVGVSRSPAALTGLTCPSRPRPQTLLAVGRTRRAVWGALYLDEHGEEDRGMRRGHNLALDARRMEALRLLLARNDVVQDTSITTRAFRKQGLLF